MTDGQLPFAFDDESVASPASEGPLADALASDRDAREYAVNPAVHVALEASAGTGKTKVLVDRYVNLLRAGVEPRRVLAITFTRKAAAEMRARIVAELTRLAEIGAIPDDVWKALRGRLSEIAISTIDAFCLSLLGEFPLEADVDPGFAVADETETPRLQDEALDRFLRRAPQGMTADVAAARATARLVDVFAGGRLSRLIATGPDANDFRLLATGLAHALTPGAEVEPGEIADLLGRLRDYAVTKSGSPRKRPRHKKAEFPPGAAYQTHTALVGEVGAEVPRLVDAHRADVNVVLARSLRWLTARAIEQYRQTLDEHAMVDFTDALVKALALLERMEEF